MKMLSYYNNNEKFIRSVNAKFHIEKSNQSCTIRLEKKSVTEITTIEKLEYHQMFVRGDAEK